MDKGLKNNIIKLRKEGKSYNYIAKELGISKGVISYHCQNEKINDIGLRRNHTKLTEADKEQINIFYQTSTLSKTSLHFDIPLSTLKKIVNKKRIKLSDEEIKNRNYNKVKSRRQKLKKQAVEYMGSKCQICGYDKCVWAFDFHHKNPNEKEFEIARYLTLSWEKIKVELEKCLMLCANCHRELHYEVYLNKK